jgi:hypothetical protein
MPDYAQAGLAALEVGQAIQVLYWVDRGQRDLIVQSPRHTDGPRGTFALRSPVRPNPIALGTVVITGLDRNVVIGSTRRCVRRHARSSTSSRGFPPWMCRRAGDPGADPYIRRHGQGSATRNYKVIAENRRARFDYAIEDDLEVGIVLEGSEVKSLREGQANRGSPKAMPPSRWRTVAGEQLYRALRAGQDLRPRGTAQAQAAGQPAGACRGSGTPRSGRA